MQKLWIFSLWVAFTFTQGSSIFGNYLMKLTPEGNYFFNYYDCSYPITYEQWLQPIDEIYKELICC